MKIEIKHKHTGKILFSGETADLSGADLSGADLSGADLSGADLYGATLSGANLCGATLSGANLYGATLSGATLSGANLYGATLSGATLYGATLSGANLSGADLRNANLYGADLSGATLSGANLYGADLRNANLYGADLSGATLSGANLYGADLSGAKIDPIASARLSIVPESGHFTGWKKCREKVIVRVEIPPEAKRSNATGRKCRADYVKVIEVIGGETGVSLYDGKTKYKAGETVKCDQWNPDRWVECGGGIHFFITRAEAEAYEE